MTQERAENQGVSTAKQQEATSQTPTPPQDAPRRPSRKDSPTWQRVEAVSRVYYTVCRQVARMINAFDR